MKMNDVDLDGIQVSFPEDGVAQLRIASQPLGVLRHRVKRALLYYLHQLEANQDIRCIVLTGTDNAFSVGSDIKDFSTEIGWLLENDYVEAGLNAAIEQSRLPVIAALNGHTLGGGAVLALACDIRFAAESAKIGFPEVNVGAFASGSGTQRLPRLIGRGRAMDLFLTGRTISAEEALEYGLVEFVTPDGDLMKEAIAYAKVIAEKPSGVLHAIKDCVVSGLRDGFEKGLALEIDYRIKTGRGLDAREGRQAFLEKRRPRFNQGVEE